LRQVVDHPPIQKPAHIYLSAEAAAVLRAMFSAFNQIVIEAQFGHGLSGSQVFQVHPVADGPKVFLPAVVKIGRVGLIQQEWQAYQAWVEGTLPDIAQIEAAPALASNRPWDGLRYTLAGVGVFLMFRACIPTISRPALPTCVGYWKTVFSKLSV
jgi:hypothetical protein